MDQSTYSSILKLLRTEVKPALGCTEPIAVALAVARAAAEGGEVESVVVKVSPNILKNAMGVGIPGTDQVGLPVATALAVVAGNHEYGLEVLKDVNQEAVSQARKMLAEGRIEVQLAPADQLLYIEAECIFKDGGNAVCIIQGTHDSITYLSHDGKVVFDCRTSEDASSDVPQGDFLTLSLIHEFAASAPLEDLEIIREQISMNTALAEEGFRGDYGLKVGKTIRNKSHEDTFGNTLITECMAATAAASDARMAGCPMPAMSNSGSGNQGITVSLPVIITARRLGNTDEELIRALAMANLTAIHIKSYLGRLSALCGCVVASSGASCGIVMLDGGGIPEMEAAIKNMVGNIAGMLCDGAKESCAMKVASGVSCAVQSAVLARDRICANRNDGIIDDDVEKTIRNLGLLGRKGMKPADKVVLDIMLCK